MPARKGHKKKVNQYSLELKRTAVRLTEAPGARVKDVAECDRAVRRYIAHYNRRRPHSAPGYRSPIDYERTNA